MAEGTTMVEIIGKEIIKPSSPTPPHLESYKLSFLDQLCPAIYTSIVLFYPKNDDAKSDQISHHLKKSLSEALTRFYPLVGRIINGTTIDCKGNGVPFVEAKFNGFLSTLLDQPDSQVLKQLVPAKNESPEAGTGPLMLIQATFFNCGGLVLGVCMSHKVADAATISMVLKGWASCSNGGDCTYVPDFSVASHFPPRELPLEPLPAAATEHDQELKKEVENCVTKRYVFEKLTIAALKAKAASDEVKQPTRVEVITALIWKCAIKALRLSSSSNSKLHKHCVLVQLVNIRKRVEPPFPENSFGNLLGYLTVQSGYEDKQELGGLVSKLRKAIKDYSENKAKKLRGKEALELHLNGPKEPGDLVSSDDVSPFFSASWCNFGFYEVDFGWGRPIWATRIISPFENSMALLDTREGDGVEVLLTLSKETMAAFERDTELLQFASPF
ncbi:Transferase [Parasponia andersonii]|uniref:Transferase n=1 Tax=Parasponia andersonii TaxID=3476 RepID=A0A2P5C9M0_PARAD|nr:Transferase [Parasponia andersonii]